MAEYSATIARDEAMRLTDRGFIPIELHAGSKKPVNSGWQNSPLPTHDQIKEIWTDETRYNLGVLTGDRSNHLQALDFDIYSKYAQWMSDYNPPKTKVVFTYRGASPIYRISDGDTLSGKMSGNAGDLLGNNHQRVWKPSVITTKDKTQYGYWDTSDPIADIPADHPALVALIREIEQKAVEKASGKGIARRTDKKIARLAKAYFEGRINTFGKHYASESELDAAVILSLYKSGFEADEIYVKMDGAEQRSHWHAYKQDSDRIAEIDRVIRKAGDSDSRQWAETMRRADALHEFRTSHIWKGSFEIPGATPKRRINKAGEILSSRPRTATGSAIEAVLLAHETKARDAVDYQYQLDVRSGDGRFANMSRKTFQNAQRFIVKSRIIQLIMPNVGTCSNYYELNQVKKMASLVIPELEKKSKSDPTSSQLTPTYCDEVGQLLLFFESGVFEWKSKLGLSLGRSAGLIYRTCLSGPMSPKEIAAATGRCLKTVRDTLPKLLKYELVIKTGTKYQSDPNVNWAALGQFLMSDRIVGNRKDIHKAQRIARAKKWAELKGESPAVDPVAIAKTPAASAPAPSVKKASTPTESKPLNHYDREAMPTKRQRSKEKVR